MTLDVLKIRVNDRIAELQKTTRENFGRYVPYFKLTYDLKTASLGGQARHKVDGSLYHMRLHPAALMEYKDEYIDEVVVHEFAHLVQGMTDGSCGSKPHGHEWKRVMRVFGATPDVTHTMDLDACIVKHGPKLGIKPRKKRVMRKWNYHCNCRNFEISTVRHNKIVRGGSYRCGRCRTAIREGKLIK